MRPDYDDIPWDPQDADNYRRGRDLKPIRAYFGPTPKQTELMYRNAKGASRCPDCHRWHVDDHDGAHMGRCFSCYMREVKPAEFQTWCDFHDARQPQKPDPENVVALKPIGKKATK
jgi:hypothetical protein